MKKVLLCSLLILAVLATAVVPAMAAEYPYKFEGTKQVVQKYAAPKGPLVYAMIEQETYRYLNNESRIGTQCNYGARKTATSITKSSIFTVVTFYGDTGATVAGQALYNDSPSLGALVYMVANPKEANTAAQMKGTGTWTP